MRTYTYTFRQMVLILIYSVLFAAVLGAAAAGGCGKSTSPVETGDVSLPRHQCMVGRFRIVAPGQAESPQPPVCAILCQWDRWAGIGSSAVADGVPVPCTWYGQQVIVEQRVNSAAVDPVKVTP